jgi:hypothetical protein
MQDPAKLRTIPTQALQLAGVYRQCVLSKILSRTCDTFGGDHLYPAATPTDKISRACQPSARVQRASATRNPRQTELLTDGFSSIRSVIGGPETSSESLITQSPRAIVNGSAKSMSTVVIPTSFAVFVETRACGGMHRISSSVVKGRPPSSAQDGTSGACACGAEMRKDKNQPKNPARITTGTMASASRLTLNSI